MKKLISAILAVALVLIGVCAFAEEDLQAQLDAANARIAELEAQIALYKPVFDSVVVASYGNGNVLLSTEAMAEYENAVAMYKQYGIDPEAYGMADSIKEDIVSGLVQNAVLGEKAVELGLDNFSEEELAAMEEEFAATLEQYSGYYLSQMYPDAEETTDAMRAEAEDYWAQNGLAKDSFVEEAKKSGMLDKLYAMVTEGVEATEEDVQAAYEAMIAKNQVEYASDRTYNSDRNSGVAIAWNPEGYRAVKQVLIKFDDDQQSRYTDLNSQIASLESEKAALDAPVEEGAEETEKRDPAMIDADIAACKAELEALYAELDPRAQEVIDAFNAGEAIETLIEKYNDDPGMMQGVTAEKGYAVREGSDAWDPSFTQAAMSIDKIGGISAPTNGSYGKYIVYYFDDIPAGNVALGEIHDEVAADALNDKIAKTYDDQVAAWMEEAGVQYFLENMK